MNQSYMQAYVGRYLRNVARVLNLFYKDFVSFFVLVLLSQPLVVNILDVRRVADFITRHGNGIEQFYMNYYDLVRF